MEFSTNMLKTRQFINRTWNKIVKKTDVKSNQVSEGAGSKKAESPLERVRREYTKDYYDGINSEALEQLEKPLKEKGIKTIGQGYSRMGNWIYHGQGITEPIGYGDPYLTLKYKDTTYSIHSYNESLTPVQLKRQFVKFLEGEGNIKDFRVVGIPEVDKNSELYQNYKAGKISFQEYYPKMCKEYQEKLKENPQPENPFWEITASKEQ